MTPRLAVCQPVPLSVCRFMVNSAFWSRLGHLSNQQNKMLDICGPQVIVPDFSWLLFLRQHYFFNFVFHQKKMPLSAALLFTNGHSTCFIWQSLVCFPRDLLLVRHSQSTKFMFYSNLKMSRPLQESWPLDLFSLSLSVSLWKLLVQMKPVCHCYLNMKKENLNFEGHRDVVTG